jgi:hypothetical protein
MYCAAQMKVAHSVDHGVLLAIDAVCSRVSRASPPPISPVGKICGLRAIENFVTSRFLCP